MIISNTASTHIELLLINPNESGIKEGGDNISFRDFEYDKVFVFFAGFQQKPEMFVPIFGELIETNQLYRMKILIISNKSYKSHYTLKNILSDDKLSKLSHIRSYFRKDYELDSSVVAKPIWDAALDLVVIKLIIAEYEKLNCDWNKIKIAGFSMGGRYSLHIVELLNSRVNTLIVLKSFVTNYIKGQSSFESLKGKFNHSESGQDVEKSKIALFNAGCYSTIYNSKQEISDLFEELSRIFKLPDKTISYMDNIETIDKIRVILRFSLNDPIVNPKLELTLNLLQSQLRNYYLSFDKSSKHSLDSTVSLLVDELSREVKEVSEI